MIKQKPRITPQKAEEAAKSTLEFWSSLDGTKLDRIASKEKYADLAGPKRLVTLSNK